MSEYGIKIKNYQAGSIFEVENGVRQQYDSKDAMLTNSLFLDFLMENGLKVHEKSGSTRDVIGVEFKYGSRAYKDEKKHIEKLIKECDADDESRMARLSELRDFCDENKDKYVKCSNWDIRISYYENGITIKYPIFKKKEIVDYEEVHYKMLYRSAGKAKKGTCMFICDRLYDIAHNFLWMGLELPFENAPIVEIGAYSALITSTIVGKVQIKPEEILILKDVKSSTKETVISVELDDHKMCVANTKYNYECGNELFDGQALIDSSIFPAWGDGFILLRHHFTKCAAFCSHIQKYFKDRFGEDYETAEVTDMWGNKRLAKDIKMITTDNAVKWLKFDIDFDYWANYVRANDSMWGIVKTAHPSKLGNVQRTSYQMINALSEEMMDSVLKMSKDYIWQLKTNDEVFLDYLAKNSNFSNDYEVLIALTEHNRDFLRTDYFRDRKRKIIEAYVLNLKNGRTIQNADNMTIVGSPYAMLLHASGDNPLSDPTFEVEDCAMQCWTNRFDDGEFLAEFRSPFNSRNNLGYLHNHHHEFLTKYFELGKLCIAVNMIGTSFQNRNNGLSLGQF